MFRIAMQLGLLIAATSTAAAVELPKLEVPFRTLDLNVGESGVVEWPGGLRTVVKLVKVDERRDNLCQAVRDARVTVAVEGREVTLTSANYRLPQTVGRVQIDCAAAKGIVLPDRKNYANPWALDTDARLRLWPAGAAWIDVKTFRYPAGQRWFATSTQMANEPVFVNGCEKPSDGKQIYYHWGLDIGGAEGQVEVTAAAESEVLSAGLATIDPEKLPPPVKKRADVVYLRDGRGWCYRYSHLHTIDPAIVPGARVRIGQRIGLLGKEGGSGGWSHLHFDISAPQPSGRWGIVEGYAFLWLASLAERPREVQAVARPHQIAWTAEDVVLDATRSWSKQGRIVRYEWLLADGSQAAGATVRRRYDRPGAYSELLRITDAEGRVDYDATEVHIFDRDHPDRLPPSIHAVYYPTLDLKPGQPITFKVRSFRIRPDEGSERWDFGDGSPAVEVRSDGNAKTLAKDGYAVTTHAYSKPGVYLVSVRRTNDRGETASARLHVHVEK